MFPILDVFEHHRFCDDFSHLLNGCYPSFASLYKIYFSRHLQVIADISHLFNRFLLINGQFHQFTCSLYKMFLSITDSVMISHIFLMDLILHSQVSIKLILVDICKFLMTSNTYSIDFSWSMDYSINLHVPYTRCFWASQILWWFLTSS